MVDHWLTGKKYVIATRATRHDPASTKFYASLYYWLVRLFVIKDYPRGGFDLILVDKQIIPYIRDSSKNINTELLSYWLGIRPVAIPYERQERIHGLARHIGEETHPSQQPHGTRKAETRGTILLS